jgi:uncharacterized SAM-binding protein YcdF (DUF218 family)
MFFLVSKVASLFLLPYPFFYFCGLFGLLAYRRRIPGRKPGWPVLLYLMFGVMSTDAFASYLLRLLEDRFPRLTVTEVAPADAAIVLGSISNPLASVDETPQFTDGVDRLLTTMDLFKAGKIRYIILTGKSLLIDHKGNAESEDLKNYLVQRGFPADRILVDAESRNTAENLQYGLKLGKEHNLRSYYLVTSAFHMYRSVRTYDRVKADHYADLSIEMTPFPVDYRSDRIPSGIERYFPTALSVFKSSLAIKEFMGLLAYTAKGYISFDRLVSDFKTVDF